MRFIVEYKLIYNVVNSGWFRYFFLYLGLDLSFFFYFIKEFGRLSYGKVVSFLYVSMSGWLSNFFLR